MSKEQTHTLPEKIFAVNYAGFWDFSEDGLYGDSVINEMDYPNAEQIAGEMSKRYNEYPDLLAASLQNAELLKEKLELIDMLDEARAQIEYMQEYTGPMGTCSTVLSRIESLIEKYTDKK